MTAAGISKDRVERFPPARPYLNMGAVCAPAKGESPWHASS
jgi:hypothetical protein